MVSRRQHITSVVLLASYLLAGATTWLHTVHRCGSDCRPKGAVSGILHPAACGTHHHDGEHALAHTPVDLPGQSLGTNRALGTNRVGSEQPAPDSDPQHDDCTLCQFQLAKKLAEFAPIVIAHSVVGSEQIVLALPPFRVAQLAATPDGRAPPCLA